MEPREYARMFSLEASHWWYRALRRNLDRALAGVLAGRPAVLDAGCGTGMLLAAWRDRARGVGLDASAEALELARRRDLGPLVRGSVERLPLRSESFDLVVSADVLYHRGVADDVGALREFARVLKPGGTLALNLTAFAWLRSGHDAAIHTARRYTAREVRAKLAAAGLRPVRVRYWNSLLFPPIALVRLARRGRAGAAEAPASDLAPLPGWLNGMLNALLALETRLALWPAPAGLSVLAVARKESAR
jgi:SAM-dependent methyltransferase